MHNLANNNNTLEAHTTTHVAFSNPGLIDMQAVTTFGVSVKTANDHPIGIFGTGLKYAIAVLLREGHKIIIDRGGTLYHFQIQTDCIRNKEFDIVYMNGTPLGFTTSLGKNWELWQAFREIYCNCLDENGSVEIVEEGTSAEVSVSSTTIRVYGEDFLCCAADKEQYFCEATATWEEQGIDIHKEENCCNVFYRNVKVGEYQEPFLYKYNITRAVSLTEDRTLKYDWEFPDTLARAVLLSTNEEFIEAMLTADEAFFESKLDFNQWASCEVSDEYLNVVSRLYKKKQRMNSTGFASYVSRQEEKLQYTETVSINIEQQSKLNAAKNLLLKMGLEITDIRIVKSLGGAALITWYEDICYIAEEVFEGTQAALTLVLIEGAIRHEEGLGDVASNSLTDALCERLYKVYA